MKANPGGNLDPDHVVGRDRLIDQIWDLLESQSILINAERRIGKTQVLRKMLKDPCDGWIPVFRDFEDIYSAQEFAEHVYDDVQEFLGTQTRAKNFIQRLLEKSETDYVNISERAWKELLTSAIEDLAKTKTPSRLVFFWDEIPYMLENIRQANGNRVAAQVLDTLRSLRIENDERFRVIFTGSIGLHHILSKLTEAGIPSSPVNDMFKITVTPLAPTDAHALAVALLEGEALEFNDLETAAQAIAEEVDCFPFYMHHIVAGLKLEERQATRTEIQDFISRQLVDAADPWELAHYRKRLPTYYPEGNDAQTVTAILDVLAMTEDADTSLAVNEIMNNMHGRNIDVGDRDNLLRLLRLMDADHYVSRDINGKYRFRFSLIRRWWMLDRGL